jgi:ATP-dependent RNA helicase DeaD
MDQDERGRAGVARSHNVLYVLPEDAAAVSQVLDPILERVDPAAGATQLLVLTPDADMAIAVAKAATRAPHGTPVRVLPVTGVRRASRLLRSRAAPAVAGTPADILELIRAAALKLDEVRVLVIAWVDAMLDTGAAEHLEAVMAEVPKEAARIVSASQLSPQVEEIVERYARRPRRVGADVAEEARPIDLRYVTVARSARARALRRLLDDLDPEATAIYARSDEGAREIAETIRGLGYGEEQPQMRITRGEPVPGATLLVLYEFPASAAELLALAGDVPPEVVALAQPRQLAALRALAAGGRTSTFTLSGPAALARHREDAVRAEIRSAMSEGPPAREMLALEPLLPEFDGIEIAAAVLRLLDGERERSRHQPVTHEDAETRGAAATGMVQLFVNAGARDNIGARELVGAIANEVGLPVDHVGKIDVRDNYSIVEVVAGDAPAVINGLTGMTMRGRQLLARPAGPRPQRESGRPSGPGGRDRGERRGSSDRGDRRSPGARGAGARGERRGTGERRGVGSGDRRDRDDRGTRGPRPPRPRSGEDAPTQGTPLPSRRPPGE